MAKPSQGKMRYSFKDGALFCGRKEIARLIATYCSDKAKDCPESEMDANGRRIAKAWNALNESESQTG